jgi:DNA-binding transcriptional MerR regulator
MAVQASCANILTVAVGLSMEGLTIQEASAATGWSARMLRYIEDSGLVVPIRSPGGYRIFGEAELHKLRTLRELLCRYGVGLAEMGFASRLRMDRILAEEVDNWLSDRVERPSGSDTPTSRRWNELRLQGR